MYWPYTERVLNVYWPSTDRVLTMVCGINMMLSHFKQTHLVTLRLKHCIESNIYIYINGSFSNDINVTIDIYFIV